MLYTEFTIPKKNGKVRKICAPSPVLKSEQRNTLPELYSYFEQVELTYNLDGVFHGFLPGRNVVTAAQKHIGYEATLMMDIKDFFDSVTKDMLKDHETETDAIKELHFHELGYCAQGFVTSPVLANIAIAPHIGDFKNYCSLNEIDVAITVYADDIQISFNDPTKEKVRMLINLVTSFIENGGFQINPGKTRVKFSKYGWRRILGVNVGDTEVRATRKTMRKIRAARHGGNKASLGGLVTWSKCMLPKRS